MVEAALQQRLHHLCVPGTVLGPGLRKKQLLGAPGESEVTLGLFK